MVRDFIMSLVATFVLDPLQADVKDRLATLNAPPAIIQDVRACAGAASSALIDRAMSDWAWGASTAVRLALGTTTPERVVADIAPSCGPALQAARTFMVGNRA